MSAACAVEFRGVAKAFGPNAIFAGLDLSVQRGEVLTIVGGSGSGKSVMLKMMLGLLEPDSGEVRIDGEDITGLNEADLWRVRHKVGMVFQGGALFDSMNVFDNVSYALAERGERDQTVLQKRVAEVLDMVGLKGTEQLMPSELSGGMKKRVALARAVALVPSILLYDEPTTGLDPMNVRRISELILHLRAQLNVTSIVVTHDLASAFFISDRMAMLASQHIVEVCETAAFRQSSVPAVKEFLGAMQVLEQAQGAPP
jgi:phospholipid/cholesterol/gamma-HCH transport system ATP-binding protein